VKALKGNEVQERKPGNSLEQSMETRRKNFGSSLKGRKVLQEINAFKQIAGRISKENLKVQSKDQEQKGSG
jgi:hypothetical protein